MRITTRAAAGAACLLVFASMAARAETVTYRAELAGTNEVPANDSAAAGEAVVNFDTETRVITWTVTYSGLSTPLIGAHFHGPAEPGANAGVLVPLIVRASPMEGSVKLTEEQAGFLKGGSIYVNLHTEHYPGGELRGNLMQTE